MFNKHQVRIRRLALVMVLSATTVPVSIYARGYLQSTLDSLHVGLRTNRIKLTRMQQDVHQLEGYATRLRGNKTLLTLVTQQSLDGTTWQTPMSRARLALEDAVDRLNIDPGDIDSISIDWLDQSRSQELKSAQVRRLWLSAKVASVPDGIALIKGLSNTVFPYPLTVRGCGYRREQGMNPLDTRGHIEMRCLLTLITWTLPLLRLDNLAETGSVRDASDAESLVESDVTSMGVESVHNSARAISAPVSEDNRWKLFKFSEAEESDTETESVIQSTPTPRERPTRSPEPTANLVKPKGVFTGPAGTLVIHGQ